MKKYFFLIVFLNVIFLNDVFSAESQKGYMCYRTGVNGVGYGSTVTEAVTQMCAHMDASYYNDTQCKGGVVVGVGCLPTAVCLGGAGYVAANADGSCPEDSEDDGDDDDKDGSDCDKGEESGKDCNDGDDDDTDRDGDGEADSEDGDDGYCFPFEFKGDGSKDSDCDPEDEEDDCKKGEKSSFTIPEANIPNLICSASCEFIKTGSVCIGFGSTPDETTCYYESNGKSCDSDTETKSCPSDQAWLEGKCQVARDYCKVDVDNDGVADNKDATICKKSCSKDDPNCKGSDKNDNGSGNSVSDFSCKSEKPPVCQSENPVDCALLKLSWQKTCGVTFTSVVDCDISFQCNGNPIECAKLSLDRENFCSTQLSKSQQASPDSLANFKTGIDDGESYRNGKTINLKDAYKRLDDKGFGLSRQCIKDYKVNAKIANFVIPFSKWCDLMEAVGKFVLVLGFFFGARIIGEVL